MKPGLLFYGYSKEDADTIHTTLTKNLNQSLFKKSASGKESETIEQLLSSSSDQFENNNPKIIMLVSMDDAEIQKSINSYPKTLVRPIFCCLTPHNLTWPFLRLKEHLLEEQAYWQQKK